MRRGLLIAAVAVAASLVLSPCDESAPTAGQGGSWLPSTVGQALAQPVQHGDRLVTQVASATQPVDPSQWIDAPADARFTTLGWFAPTSRSVAKPPLPAEVTRAYVIPVREAITDKLALVLRRKAAEALKNNAQMVIFDLETPGGSIAAMLEINRLISNDLKDVYTVAWVNDRAYSAGALISLACTEIVMTRSGIIGDAMPIMAGPAGIQEIPEKERGKMESALRGEVRVLAGQAGYDVDLCEAMITIDMELWLIRNRGDRRGGELMIVNADEYRERVAGVPISISQTQPANPAAAEWEFVRQIVGPTKLVTLTNDEATLYGLNSRTVNSMAELRDAYNITAEPVVIEDVWSEQLVGFLTSPFVATMLLIVGGLLFYVEMHTPGFGVAGSLAIACLALLLGSHYLIGLANWWEIALIVLGVILLVLEIFFIPGFGVAGGERHHPDPDRPAWRDHTQRADRAALAEQPAGVELLRAWPDNADDRDRRLHDRRGHSQPVPAPNRVWAGDNACPRGALR